MELSWPDSSSDDISITVASHAATKLLAAVPAVTAWPALAQDPPAALAAYERDTGGRIGLYAEDLATGAKITWRADERFVMCSTFKASCAARSTLRSPRWS